MRSLEQVMIGLTCDKHGCDICPYKNNIPKKAGCCVEICQDCKDIIEQLVSENEKLKGCGEYWENICKLNAKQEAKGKSKYGVPLEENTTLTRKQRIEHLEEELIDGLKYCEHLKAIDDDGITANDYQRSAMRTAGDDEESYLLNGVMGLCGESGEVIDLVKKHLHQGHELDPVKIVEELGDVLWYCALIAEAVGATLSEVMLTNIKKLEERYPSGFDKARSIHREENNDKD